MASIKSERPRIANMFNWRISHAASNLPVKWPRSEYRTFSMTTFQSVAVNLRPYADDYWVEPMFDVVFVRRGSQLETILLLAD